MASGLYSKILSISWTGVILASLFFNARSASARAFPSISDHLKDMFPTKNVSGGPAGEIQCYALPYGSIGIVSHLLTYWTVAWMGVGRSPIWPFHHMDSGKFDMALSTVSLLTCIPLASISIHRCRLSWHFVLIGVWKLITSVTQSCVAIHRALLIHKATTPTSDTAILLQNTTPHLQQTQYQPAGSQPTQQRPGLYKQSNVTQTSFFHSSDNLPPEAHAKKPDLTPLYWLILYYLGTITGMVGLGALVIADFRQNYYVRCLTYGFIAIVVVLALTTGFYWYKRNLENSQGGYVALRSAYIYTFGGSFMTALAAFGFFSALYSDLVLGAIAGNWAGFPGNGNEILYWAWFAAKRIPMFSH